MSTEAPRRFGSKEELLEAIQFSPQFIQSVVKDGTKLVGLHGTIRPDGIIVVDLTDFVDGRPPLSNRDVDEGVKGLMERRLAQAREVMRDLWDATRKDTDIPRGFARSSPRSWCRVLAYDKVNYGYYVDEISAVVEINLRAWTYNVTKHGMATNGSLLRAEDVLRFQRHAQRLVEDLGWHSRQLEAAARGMD